MLRNLAPPRLAANRRYPPPNNRVRSHITAAKPRLTALCNSRAPPAALGRQESVRRAVVCKSVARTHAVSPGLEVHNRRAEPELCSCSNFQEIIEPNRSHKVRNRNWDTPLGLMRHPPKASRRLLRERKLSSWHSPSCCADARRPQA